jgi:site-specific recombinase XerD
MVYNIIDSLYIIGSGLQKKNQGVCFVDETPKILQDFLNYMETIRGKSRNTIKEYQYDLRMFLKYVKYLKNGKKDNLDDIDISDVDSSLLRGVTLSDLYSFISYAGRDRENSATTRARKVASIRSFRQRNLNPQKYLRNCPVT